MTVAGHTHGGQVWLPLLGRPAVMIASVSAERYAIGVVHENGRTLFVSPGIGTSNLPDTAAVCRRRFRCWRYDKTLVARGGWRRCPWRKAAGWEARRWLAQLPAAPCCAPKIDRQRQFGAKGSRSFDIRTGKTCGNAAARPRPSKAP